ncbi:MAG: VWA domain-containing protein [Acidobacteria bacterium]|nr:VWA domain-containing protein [Acidobacteriota bacterium]
MTNEYPHWFKFSRVGPTGISLVTLSVFLGFAIAAARIGLATDQEPQTTIRAEVGLVNIVFTAADKKGRPVPGLKAEDFEVFDNKRPQKIEFFSDLGKSSDVPLTIALLIDTSGSVKDKLEFEKATAAEFFKEILRPTKDLALIIQFDSEVNLVQDFTQSYDALLDGLDSLTAGNSTSLYDAVYLAAEEKLKYEAGRKVMVIVADGDDNTSKVRREEAIEAAQKNDVIIYGIGVQTQDSSFGALKKFAEETGGAFFSPRARFSEIQDAFRSIREDIQGQYSLAYSLNARKDGSFHTIELRCKISGVKIRARKGYYAPKATPRERE